MFEYKKFHITVPILILFGVVVLSGCFPTAKAPVSTENRPIIDTVDNPIETSPENNTSDLNQSRENPAKDDVEEEVPVQEQDKEPVKVPVQKSGFEATNPKTVRLASGDIQFIEFFAFW